MMHLALLLELQLKDVGRSRAGSSKVVTCKADAMLAELQAAPSLLPHMMKEHFTRKLVPLEGKERKDMTLLVQVEGCGGGGGPGSGS